MMRTALHRSAGCLAGLAVFMAALWCCGDGSGQQPGDKDAPEKARKTRPGPAPRLAGSAPAPRVLTDRDLERLWQELGRDDQDGVAAAYAHINAMIQSPDSSVAFLKKRLQAVPAPGTASIDQWIADLDSNDFEAREKAMTSLEKVGPLAAPALRKKMAAGPPLEAKRRIQQLLDKLNAHSTSADDLRAARSVEVLFGIGTPAARAVLQELAQGAPGARLTEEAQRSLAALKALSPGR